MTTFEPLTTTSSSPGGRLAGKVALVTGGGNSQGFGASIATRFAAEGAKVLITDLDGPGASSVAASLSNPNAKSAEMDVSSEADWKRVVEGVVADWGRLDIVINNAGTTYRNKPSLEVTEEEYERVFRVNVKSVFWCAKVAIPVMQKQGGGGCVVNVSSVGSVRPRPGLVWYNASKGAVSNVSAVAFFHFGPD